MKNPCLSIAGFDSSGGAGLQADLKTFSALACYGMTVVTAVPVQNTCGVRSCYDLPLSCIQEQLEAIFDDITPRAIKIGMLFSTGIIELVAEFLQQRAKGIPIVLDPVMVAKSGHALLQPEAILALKTKLLPAVDLVTPNLPEAFALVGQQEDFTLLGQLILDLGAQAVLIKGGHADSAQANDLLMNQAGQHQWFYGQRIASKNTHGTGCTLSAAIAAYLARDYPLPEAIQAAKLYLGKAIKASAQVSLGKGHGPVHHFFEYW